MSGFMGTSFRERKMKTRTEQLDALYAELSKHPMVMMML